MEKNVRIIEVKRSIFENNDRDADRLRAELKEKKVFLLNLMSSPGSGKTTMLLALSRALKGTPSVPTLVWAPLPIGTPAGVAAYNSPASLLRRR